MLRFKAPSHACAGKGRDGGGRSLGLKAPISQPLFSRLCPAKGQWNNSSGHSCGTHWIIFFTINSSALICLAENPEHTEKRFAAHLYSAAEQGKWGQKGE